MQDYNSSEDSPSGKESSSIGYLPVLLIALSLVIWFAFQLSQTLKARDELVAAYDNQQTQVETANKIKQSLSALATSTKQLANQGNTNAIQIVNALTQRGITIADPQAPSPPQSTEQARPSDTPSRPKK